MKSGLDKMSTTNTSFTKTSLTRGPFECGVCTVEYHEGQPCEALGYLFCEGCAEMVAGQFREALQHELSFPPRWGEDVIPVEPFLKLLPQGFAVRYAKKKIEYEMPLAKRLYCERRKQVGDPAIETGSGEICGNFLGVRSKLD